MVFLHHSCMHGTSRHEPWDEDDVRFSFEVALDHLCAFNNFKKHWKIEKLAEL